MRRSDNLKILPGVQKMRPICRALPFLSAAMWLAAIILAITADLDDGGRILLAGAITSTVVSALNCRAREVSHTVEITSWADTETLRLALARKRDDSR